MDVEVGAELTKLEQWRAGDQQAESRLYELLMPELRKIAERCLRRERKDHTLQRTELVNEAFMHLLSCRFNQPTRSMPGRDEEHSASRTAGNPVGCGT